MRVFTTNKRLRDRLDNYSNLLWAADAKLKDLTAENDKLKDENDKLNGWVDELIRIGEMTISGYGTSPWNELLSRIRKEREE